MSDNRVLKVHEEPSLDQAQEEIKESKVKVHGPPDLK
jgi:hypothetical protein